MNFPWKTSFFLIILVSFLTQTVSINAQQFFPPPLQQIKQGIPLNFIKCSSNFNFLVVIREDHTVEPACVKSNTMLRLENQGWMTLEKFESMHYPFPYQKPKVGGGNLEP